MKSIKDPHGHYDGCTLHMISSKGPQTLVIDPKGGGDYCSLATAEAGETHRLIGGSMIEEILRIFTRILLVPLFLVLDLLITFALLSYIHRTEECFYFTINNWRKLCSSISRIGTRP